MIDQWMRSFFDTLILQWDTLALFCSSRSLAPIFFELSCILFWTICGLASVICTCKFLSNQHKKIIMYLFQHLHWEKSSGLSTMETMVRLKGWRQKILQKLKEKLPKAMTALFVIFCAIIYEISFHFESSLIFSHFSLRHTHMSIEERRPFKMIQSRWYL